jgi:large subunit ribosomal protein L23
MALRDIFKKRQPKKEIEKKEEKQKEVKEEKQKKEAVLEKKPKRIKEKKSDIAYRVLKAPQVTEKATNLSERNQYIFKVYPDSNKPQIKKAVEDLYDVDVLSVKIINVRKKKRRLGRISGWRAGYKKAMVKIKEGQKIEIMPR